MIITTDNKFIVDEFDLKGYEDLESIDYLASQNSLEFSNDSAVITYRYLSLIINGIYTTKSKLDSKVLGKYSAHQKYFINIINLDNQDEIIDITISDFTEKFELYYNNKIDSIHLPASVIKIDKAGLPHLRQRIKDLLQKLILRIPSL